MSPGDNSKSSASTGKLAERARVQKSIAFKQDKIRELTKAVEGQEADLRRYEDESFDERLKRRLKVAIRVHMNDVRYDLTGSRRKDPKKRNARIKVYEYLVKQWVRQRRPKDGIVISQETLAARLDMAPRHVRRAIKVLKKRWLSCADRGQNANRYGFPAYPDKAWVAENDDFLQDC